MGHAEAWVIDIILPAILLIVLISLVWVPRKRDRAQNRRTEESTRELYTDEEERRREGTDKL